MLPTVEGAIAMGQDYNRHRHLRTARAVGFMVGGVLVVALILMNLTPGHFGFADTDGCACTASYTTVPSSTSCEASRPQHCDILWLDRLIAGLARLDLNK